MRVPSVGMPLDERLIVREGYRLAERLLRNYQDPPSLAATTGQWFSAFRQKLVDIFRLMRG